MKQGLTYEQMIEKMVRAKVRLEGAIQEHSLTCPADSGEGPCTCGADKHNAPVRSALRELEF
jgi:hypothetical protein